MWSTTTRQAAGVIPGRIGHKGRAKIRQGRRVYAERHSDSPHDKFHTGYGHAIPKGPVSGGIRRPRQIGPAVGEALEAFAFCRREPSDKFRPSNYQLVLMYILAVGPFIVAGSEGTDSVLIKKCANQVRGILILLGALRGGDITFPEAVRPLPGENGVSMLSGQGKRKILLNTEAMASVF